MIEIAAGATAHHANPASQKPQRPDRAPDTRFADMMAKGADKGGKPAAFVGDSDAGYGRIGVDVEDGRVARVNYFDADGHKMTSSGFDAPSILKLTDRFAIPSSDLAGLADVLDQKQIAYRPGEQSAKTGLDHGVDLQDLATGGTALDRRLDPKCDLKGPSAHDFIARRQNLNETQELRKTPEASLEKGVQSEVTGAMKEANGPQANWPARTQTMAAWFATRVQAFAQADLHGGTVVDFRGGERNG